MQDTPSTCVGGLKLPVRMSPSLVVDWRSPSAAGSVPDSSDQPARCDGRRERAAWFSCQSSQLLCKLGRNLIPVPCAALGISEPCGGFALAAWVGGSCGYSVGNDFPLRLSLLAGRQEYSWRSPAGRFTGEMVSGFRPFLPAGRGQATCPLLFRRGHTLPLDVCKNAPSHKQSAATLDPAGGARTRTRQSENKSGHSK